MSEDRISEAFNILPDEEQPGGEQADAPEPLPLPVASLALDELDALTGRCAATVR